jgi:hypothetical protein
MLRAEWENDCQGKRDFDCEIIGLSSRTYPRGGGFTAYGPGGVIERDEDRPHIKPSGVAHIAVDGACVLTKNFEAETSKEVESQIEQWAKEQHAKIVAAVQKALEEPA